MIPWWGMIVPTIVLVGYAYMLGKTKERERCIVIASEAVGRANFHEEARMASLIAGRISGDLPSGGKE